jgi:hypothetical protein
MHYPGIAVNEKDPFPEYGQGSRQVYSSGGLSYTALLVGYAYYFAVGLHFFRYVLFSKFQFSFMQP